MGMGRLPEVDAILDKHMDFLRPLLESNKRVLEDMKRLNMRIAE